MQLIGRRLGPDACRDPDQRGGEKACELAIAEPERYFFRGPVSWTIRTYSKFMHLPATYSSRGSHFTRAGGSMSDGTV